MIHANLIPSLNRRYKVNVSDKVDMLTARTRSPVEVGEGHDDGGVEAALEVPRAVGVAS